VEIIARIRDIRRELLERFKTAMVDRIRGEFKDPSWDADFLGTVHDLEANSSGFRFFKPAWRNLFAICFSNQARNAGNMIFGVYYWGRKLGNNVSRRVADGRLREKLEEAEYANWYHDDVIRRMALDGGG
jgi:hypothetical protein